MGLSRYQHIHFRWLNSHARVHHPFFIPMLSLGNFSLLPHSRLFAPPTSTLSPPHPCCTPMQSLGNSWHLGHIALTIPDACVVHAVRHPADTSLSSFQQSFNPASIPWSFNLTRESGLVSGDLQRCSGGCASWASWGAGQPQRDLQARKHRSAFQSAATRTCPPPSVTTHHLFLTPHLLPPDPWAAPQHTSYPSLALHLPPLLGNTAAPPLPLQTWRSM
jgi:hypothetical protein